MSDAQTPILRKSDLAHSAAEAASESKAPSTWRTYRSTWQAFERFCEARGVDAQPTPSTACAYVLELAEAGRAASTIDRAIAALGLMAELRGMPRPNTDKRFATVVEGLRRRIGVRPKRKAAITPVQLRDMVRRLPDGLRGFRDRAALLMGFAGAFRRSELVAVDLEHIEWCEEGIKVLVPRSKTDQQGEGTVKAIPLARSPELCTTRALRAWLEASGIEAGPLFVHLGAGGRVTQRRLTDRHVARLVQACAGRCGIDPAIVAGHSLRAGLITAAARAGRTDWAIMRQSGHSSPATLAAYVREARLFDDNAADGIL